MADRQDYQYDSPLRGFENLPPLSNERNEDGKSFVNVNHKVLSTAYNNFVNPISNDRRGGFDVHVYYYQENAQQREYAIALWERIRREFPELRIYRVFDKPVGPHIVAMFEVNIFTPRQFGAFIPWLVVHRGPLSALIHPNTDDELRDHTQRATWMGEKFPLDLSQLRRGD